MLHTVFSNDDMQLPEAVKKAATEYLPAFLLTEDTALFYSYAMHITNAFHADHSFERLFQGSRSDITEYQTHLLHSFEKNVQLLVEKTWVEKSCEEFKDDILYRLMSFCQSVRQTAASIDYALLLPECLGVLRDVVHLLFGTQLTSGNFLEYAVRIDPDFGLFWYYIECLKEQPEFSSEKSRIAIFVGIYFLAHF